LDPVPLSGASCLPFYRSRGRYRLHERENEEEKCEYKVDKYPYMFVL
jgi:hypothetical protein